MGKIIVLKARTVPPIGKEEWKSFWQTRRQLTAKLRQTRAKMKLLEEADREWIRWKKDLLARLAEGAAIEDEGRIAG